MPTITSTKTPLLLVNVVQMRPATDPSATPSGLRYLNPGLPGLDGPYYLPQSLPIDQERVKSMMQGFEQVARESRTPGELSGFRAAYSEDFHAGTSFAIEDELRAAADPQAQVRQRLLAARAKAQTVLLLARALEDAAVGLKDLEARLAGQWDTLESNLGLDPADALGADALPVSRANPVSFTPERPTFPKALLMESMLALIPEDVALFSADADLVADWREYGVVFAPSDQPGLLKARVAGHLLAKNRRAAPDKPWLAALRTVYVAHE